MDFYDALSSHYREVVNEAARHDAVQRFAETLAEKTGPGRALDLACGAGLYSQALAQAGMEVVGVDLSDGLLDLATRQAKQAEQNIRYLHAPMEHLPPDVHGPFSLIVCMGNSLPHLLTEDDLAAFFEGVATRLGAGGALAIHLLNYDRILASGERIVGITRSDDGLREYVRFYDFLDQIVRFNVLEIIREDAEPSHKLYSTTLRPWRAQELIDTMEASGLESVATYGSLDFEPFHLRDSDTVLLLARNT